MAVVRRCRAGSPGSGGEDSGRVRRARRRGDPPLPAPSEAIDPIDPAPARSLDLDPQDAVLASDTIRALAKPGHDAASPADIPLVSEIASAMEAVCAPVDGAPRLPWILRGFEAPKRSSRTEVEQQIEVNRASVAGLVPQQDERHPPPAGAGPITDRIPAGFLVWLRRHDGQTMPGRAPECTWDPPAIRAPG